VAKTFQVQTWMQLKQSFKQLSQGQQQWLADKLKTTSLLPAHEVQASSELA